MSITRVIYAVIVSAVLMAPAAAQHQLTGTLKKIKDTNSITLGHRPDSAQRTQYELPDQQRVGRDLQTSE
jgi:hypothetical protein